MARVPMPLSEEIRNRIRSGRIPIATGYRLFGGKGDGSLCACCDRFITGAEIQFDVECPAPKGGWLSLPMHLNCFHAWCSESVGLMPRALDGAAERDRSVDASR